jgi:hypothetical protein
LPRERARVHTLAGGGGGAEVVDLVDDVLRGGPDVVVLGWLRHFGCTLCMRQAAEWNAALVPALARGACGARGQGRVVVALVGSGTPGQAAAFAQETGFSGLLYTDPELETYAALGFARGVKSVLNRTFTQPFCWSWGPHQGECQKIAAAPRQEDWPKHGLTDPSFALANRFLTPPLSSLCFTVSSAGPWQGRAELPRRLPAAMGHASKRPFPPGRRAGA